MRIRAISMLTICPLLVGPGRPPRLLDYVDSSAGLETPAMEGGNTELEFGDLNGDGHVDIAMIGDHGSPYIGTPQHGITVWFGDGNGNWSVFQNGDFGYGGIALGDVNGDGLMDAGYGMHHDYSDTDFGDQLLEVALGDGTGQNWTPWDNGLATSGETWGMSGTDFADVDNDGDLDIGSVSFGCCAGVHVYINHGDGTWTQSWGILDGNASPMFQFGDINGDGCADFATAHGSGTVYLGDGVGGFTVADSGLPGGAGVWRTGVSLGDVNDDGRDDLAYRSSSGGLTVWSYVGPGEWEDLTGTLPASGGFWYTQIADMDLDGHGDVLAFASGLVVVYGGDGAGNWELIASENTAGSGGSAFRAGVDADHNGFPDIVLVDEEPGGNQPHYYRESSTPSYTWIQPKYPRGGEVFQAGSVRFVDWHAAVPDGQPTVDIDLSLDGPGGPWVNIAAGLPNNGRFQWHLPVLRSDSSTCRLRYTVGDATSMTPAPFTILGETGLLALRITLPDGVPEYVPPGEPVLLTVGIVDSLEAYVPGTGMVHYRYDGGEFVTSPLVLLGGALYQGALPAPGCADTPEFYFSAQGDGGTTVYNPGDAPQTVHAPGVGTVMNVLIDDFEADLGWTVENELLTDGAWERGVPADDGTAGDPVADFDGSGKCYLTANRLGNSDVDGGPTRLISPLLDLSSADSAVLRYARSWANDDQDGDPLDVEVSADDGQTWTLIEQVTNIAPGWVPREWDLGEWVELTATMRLRFSAADQPNNSIDEGAIDAVLVVALSCEDAAAVGDLNCDGVVSFTDINPFTLALANPDGYAAAFPDCDIMAGDINGDGAVDFGDINPFVVLLSGGA